MFVKKIFFVVLLFVLLCQNANGQTIGEVFKAMPDSLTPYLTTNNRLDLLDFMEAKMKAVVTNELGGQTEMTFLSDDSLCVKMNDALQLELKLEATTENDTTKVVCMKKTISTSDHHGESITQRFSAAWIPLTSQSVFSTLIKREDELFAK